MKRQYRRIASMVMAAMLLCTGCGLDVEQYLRPPKTHGEQQAVQQALENYIHTAGQDGSLYTLCYPVEGEHTSAFILCDEAGRPVPNESDEAALAVAFYTLDAAPEKTHINLLRREKDIWVSVADTVGGSSTILQAAFGDLDGDGLAELMTGWDTYNSRDRRLDVFSLANGLMAIDGNRVYNRLFTGALTMDGRDSLVLLRVESGSVYATLSHVMDGKLSDDGQVWLDSGIQQFTDMKLCMLADDVPGLYLDAVKDTDTAITELIYVQDGGLYAPFCHQTRRLNTATARPVDFAMRDVDGDGRMDMPQCRLLTGYAAGESTPDYAYRTDWMTWDMAVGMWLPVMSTIRNVADGYSLVLDEYWRDAVTTYYDETARRLSLLDVATGLTLMCLQPQNDDRDDEYTALFEASDNYAGCEVWYDSARLDWDAVQAMVARWEDGI